MKKTRAVAAFVFLLLLPAASASAKGEDMGPFVGTATITGPGLSSPIVAHWKGRCLAYCTDSALKATPTFLQLANAAGLFAARAPVSHLQPNASRLGPRYTLAFVLRSMRGGTFRNTVDLYPYGPSDLPQYIKTMPWVHAAPGQLSVDVFGSDKAEAPSGWWTAAPSVVQTLHRLGLPARPPTTTSSTNVAVAGIAGGLVGFVALLAAGAAFGRPKRRRTAA
jgi:hypothetical protein